MKDKIENLESDNANLQSQLEHLNSKMQQQLQVAPSSSGSGPPSMYVNVLKTLEKRIAAQTIGVSIYS